MYSFSYHYITTLFCFAWLKNWQPIYLEKYTVNYQFVALATSKYMHAANALNTYRLVKLVTVTDRDIWFADQCSSIVCGVLILLHYTVFVRLCFTAFCKTLRRKQSSHLPLLYMICKALRQASYSMVRLSRIIFIIPFISCANSLHQKC